MVPFVQSDFLPSFLPYTFESKTVSLVKADSEGFDSVAQSKYNPETQEHTLIVADNLIIEPYILFHEFTHILDAETYARGDKVKGSIFLGQAVWNVTHSRRGDKYYAYAKTQTKL